MSKPKMDVTVAILPREHTSGMTPPSFPEKAVAPKAPSAPKAPKAPGLPKAPRGVKAPGPKMAEKAKSSVAAPKPPKVSSRLREQNGM